MKDSIMQAMTDFVEQRPRLEFANYGNISAYRSDSRKITQQLSDARAMMREVDINTMGVPTLCNAALGDRLDIVRRADGSWVLDFAACQYWSVEYRAAVCRVLARALWTFWRDHNQDPRKAARQYLGRGIASRWFS